MRRDDVLLTSAAILLAAAIPLGVVSCDKVPLLAPTGTVITLLSTSNTVSLNSTVDLVATVIENGQATGGTGTGTGVVSSGGSGAGTPVQNGTVISFTTTIGHIEPNEARTHNGQVTVRLVTSGQSGTATITAYSGGASASLQLRIGTAAASRIQVSASPQTVGSGGGNATISALVTDDGGSGISGIPVTFSTDAGSLNPATSTTDANGVATTVLTTAATATVTAAAGGATAATVRVNVGAKALASFTATPASGPAGTPIVFTVTPNTGANILGGTIDYGDGRSDTIGAISGATSLQHVYRTAGTFTATVTANDATGGPQTLQQTVIIGAMSVTLAAVPNPVTAGAPTIITATVPTGVQVASYTFTFDEGGPITQTGNTVSKVFSARGNHVVRVDVTAVGGATGQATTNVSVQ
jgi:adhesin/invasin